MADRQRIVSGMRPTGPLHLGHYFGVLVNWLKLQQEYDCFFFVADWHALTSEYSGPRKVDTFVPELVKDWVAAGLDPDRCVIFQQSAIKNHAELHLLLSMITPLGWLERCPTYKDMKEQLAAKDLSTYGFLGYPVLMSTDILMYHPQLVPVGEDQLPHLELCREIAGRFNWLYGDFFPEPQALLTKESKLPGLDGRKMSKSYGNGIYLRETMDDVRPKVMGMLTDVNRKRREDPGDPEVCNLFPYHLLMTDPGRLDAIREGCVNATWGCVDCKRLLLESMAAFLGPIQERRRELDENPAMVREILERGNAKALEASDATMRQVRHILSTSPGKSPELYEEMVGEVLEDMGLEFTKEPTFGDVQPDFAIRSGNKEILIECKNSPKKLSVKILEAEIERYGKLGKPWILVTGTPLNAKAQKRMEQIGDTVHIVHAMTPEAVREGLQKALR